MEQFLREGKLDEEDEMNEPADVVGEDPRASPRKHSCSWRSTKALTLLFSCVAPSPHRF